MRRLALSNSRFGEGHGMARLLAWVGFGTRETMFSETTSSSSGGTIDSAGRLDKKESSLFGVLAHRGCYKSRHASMSSNCAAPLQPAAIIGPLTPLNPVGKQLIGHWQGWHAGWVLSIRLRAMDALDKALHFKVLMELLEIRLFLSPSHSKQLKHHSSSLRVS